MTDDRDTAIEQSLATWMDSHAVAPPDAALVGRCLRSSQGAGCIGRLPVAFGVIAAFLAGAGVAYARVTDLDARAMTDSMLAYGYADNTDIVEEE